MSASWRETSRLLQASMLVAAGLQWDSASDVWFTPDADADQLRRLSVDLVRDESAGDDAFSPLLATRLAALSGPVLIVGSAPQTLLAALTDADLVVVLVADAARADRLARSNTGNANVAVVWGAPCGLGGRLAFGAVIVLDTGLTDMGALSSMKSLLAPDGRLALIESGSKRSALTSRLAALGLQHTEWTLLLPDPAMPTLLVSSTAFTDHPELDARALLAGHVHAAQADPLPLEALLDGARRSLVVAGVGPEPVSVPVRFTGSHRRARFRVSTRIEHADDGLMVRRERMYPHLPTSSGPLVQEVTDEPYASGRTWSAVLDEIVSVAGWTVADIAVWFRRWIDELTRVAGSEEQLPGRFVDAIPRNLLIDGDHGRFVDLEWTWTGVLLRRTVVFRALWHSLTALVDPQMPDPSVPDRLVDVIAEVAELVGERLSASQIEHAWQFEATIQNLVSGEHVPAEALKGTRVMPAAGWPAQPKADAGALRLTLAGLEAENDALRADVNALLADLDRSKSDENRLKASIEQVRKERDAIAAHRDAVVADRELVREDLRREIAMQHQQVMQQHDKVVALTADVDRGGRTSTAHRYARAQDAVLAYERELRHRFMAEREAQLRTQVRSQRGVVAAAEAARVAEAKRADVASAALEATLARVSWRITRPLRAVRYQQLRALAKWRIRGTSTSVEVPTKKGRGAGKKTRRRASPRPSDLLIDIDFYRARYPDLAHLSDAGLRSHFGTYGQREGRKAVSWLHSSLVLPPAVPDEREKILVVLAEVGPTEQSALALALIQHLSERYHVVTVLNGGGELADPVIGATGTAVILSTDRALAGEEARMLADDLHREFAPSFAVVGSVACHEMALGLEQADVPVVALVNELLGSTTPPESLIQFFRRASELVYPAEFVASLTADVVGQVRGRGHTVALPGRVAHPAGALVADPRPAQPAGPEVSLEQYLTAVDPTDVLVIGGGPMCWRNGVDLFLDAAELAGPEVGGRRVRFVWVEGGLEHDDEYRTVVFDRHRELSVEIDVSFTKPSTQLQSLYRRADLMFLSSRHDVFSTAAVEAARQGIPVVCFEGATPFAEWLLSVSVDEDRHCVVPNLDPAKAARVLVELATGEARPRVSELMQKSAAADFGMSHYADVITRLGRRARQVRDAQKASLQSILVPDGFDVVHYTGGQRADRREYFARSYLRNVQAAAPLSQPRNGRFISRPRPGFHPLVYAESAPDFFDDGADPLAHFLSAGSPQGRWLKRVIVPQSTGDAAQSPTGDPVSVLVHGHFHYSDLLRPFLDLVATNRRPRKVVLTTTSAESVAQLRAICREHPAGEGADVILVSNRGRNLSPLLSGPVSEMLPDHDVVLHVHGKRSPHMSSEGDRWREYLWTGLLGQADGFGDQIVDEFARAPDLGLVAPEDRRLHDWDLNAVHAEDMIRRLGLSMALPTHFDFPLGAMFWARTAALRPFLDAELRDGDYPPEPLPLDGSSLHALERLIPLVIENGGYEYAKTYVPDLHR